MSGAGHHGGIEERQNIAGFIQRRHRVMVSGDNHQVTTGLLEVDHKTVVQLTRIARRRSGIKNVARHNNCVHLVSLSRLQQPVQERFMFRGAAFAVKILTQVPV